MKRLRYLLLLGLIVIAARPVEARELHWRELAVTAQLDGEGRLHVRERHAMVFTGDWNGGERVFAVRTGQQLELHAVERLDPQRGTIALVRGDLARVDQWDWSGRDTLRWRSRLSTDPPFDETEIVYALDYTLSNILQPAGDAYLLDHDFAFADREGVIERFTLELELAPEWTPPGGFALRREVADLQPGLGVLVSAELEHAGQSPLAGVTRPLSDAWRHGALLASLAAMLVLWLGFIRRERALGRFVPAPDPPRLDPGFLEEHVLSWRPEEVGALWDERVGPPEVAALIAQLVREGTLRSSVREKGRFFKRSVLELEIVEGPTGGGDLKGYESSLIGKLFFARHKKVDTDQIRAHYRTSGFDPAGVIRPALERAIKKRLGNESPPAKPAARRTLVLLLAAAGVGLAELIQRPEATLSWALLAGIAWLILYWIGFAGARRWQKALFGLGVRQLQWVLPALLLAAAYWWLPAAMAGLNPALAPRHLGTLALALAAIGAFSSLANQAATRVPAVRLVQRQRLALVRDWWREELARASPALTDELFPYLIAFGLQKRVDRWFRAHGGATAAASTAASHSGSWSGSAGNTWTGGGGAFGGGGATSAWTAAAAGLAGGVSAASSSSSGGSSGGGGGGGGSSGGGGGGGW